METIQVDFDPSIVSYRQLLEIFFRDHDPSWGSPVRQYASAVFFHDAFQEETARELLERERERRRGILATELLPYTGFTRAEDYHQKYYLRSVPGIAALYESRFPDQDGFTDSTAVARVNGYIGGNGTMEQLEREKEDLGLSEEAVEALRRILRKKRE